jgi:CheY-like chemotaxis protein
MVMFCMSCIWVPLRLNFLWQPIMSGLGTTRHLRAAGRQDLVVGVTGNALISDQNEYLAAGADQYVRSLFLIWPLIQPLNECLVSLQSLSKRAA